MLKEVLELLAPERGGIFVDGTLGGGGHSEGILKRLTDGRLYGIDRDGEAIAAASERLKPFGDKFKAIRGNFFDMKSLLANEGVTGVEGILLDLGVSSYQLDTPEKTILTTSWQHVEKHPPYQRFQQRKCFHIPSTAYQQGLSTICKLFSASAAPEAA